MGTVSLSNELRTLSIQVFKRPIFAHLELINASSKCKSFSNNDLPIKTKQNNYGIIYPISYTKTNVPNRKSCHNLNLLVVLSSVLLQISVQLTLSFKIVYFFSFVEEFEMLNTNMKVLFVANKYSSRYKHFCVALKSN